MTERYANNFTTVLAAPMLIGDGTAAVSVAAPAALQGGQFRIAIESELMLVTAGETTTTWTVTRGIEGTTPAAHAAGATVAHVLTAAGLLGAQFSVTADAGDAAKTLQYRRDTSTQIWATALGANRAVSLSATGVFIGAKFHIVRAVSATGAFNLNVGTGPLKALVPGTWCDVEYNGSAWVLTAYGAL